jgi:hypothetical protein
MLNKLNGHILIIVVVVVVIAYAVHQKTAHSTGS